MVSNGVLLKDWIKRNIARNNNICFTLSLKQWVKKKFDLDNHDNGNKGMKRNALKEMRTIEQCSPSGIVINEIDGIDFSISVFHEEKLKAILLKSGYKIKRI